MGLGETGQENSSRRLNSEVMQKSHRVRLGVPSIVNLQTEINERMECIQREKERETITYFPVLGYLKKLPVASVL